MKINASPGLEKYIELFEHEFSQALKERTKIGYSNSSDLEVFICYSDFEINGPFGNTIIKDNEKSRIYLNLLNISQENKRNQPQFYLEYLEKLDKIPLKYTDTFSNGNEDNFFFILNTREKRKDMTINDHISMLNRIYEKFNRKKKGIKDSAESLYYCVQNADRFFSYINEFTLEKIKDREIDKLIKETLKHELDHADFYSSPIVKEIRKLRSNIKLNPIKYCKMNPKVTLLLESRAIFYSNPDISIEDFNTNVKFLVNREYSEDLMFLDSEIKDKKSLELSRQLLSLNYLSVIQQIPEVYNVLSKANKINPRNIGLTTQIKSLKDFIKTCNGNYPKYLKL